MTENKVDIKQPKFFYGWIIVATSVFLLLGSFGSQQCFGVFLKPLIDDLGWSRAETSGAMSLVMGVSGIFGIIMGRLLDKYSIRIIIGIGVLIGGLAYFLLSSVSYLWQFYLYFGVGIGICVGSCYTPVNVIVSKWFDEKRTLALGITMLGISLGQTILSPLLSYIITISNWRIAYILLSIIVIVLAIPALVVMGKTPPSSADMATLKNDKQINRKYNGNAPLPRYSLRESIRTPSFWMIIITGFVLSTGFYFVASHIVTHAIDNGMMATSAALILTIMSIGGIAGALLAWSMTAKLGSRRTLFILITIQALVMLTFIWIKASLLIYIVAIIFGFCFGAATPVRMAMIPQLFGLNSIGTIIGLASFAWAVGGVTGPVLAGYVFDVTGSYSIAFIAAALLLVVGFLSVLLLKSPHEK